MEEAIRHLREVEEFIRAYPIHPEKMVAVPGRGLEVGGHRIADRQNPFSIYQDLANHIEGHIKDLIAQSERL